MNLDKGCKNICIDNNCKEDEEDEDKAQIEDEKEDAGVIDEGKNEEDDEPDFMDNSGTCWEFGSKILDEKHLKEWCQNKMGGMIVGKEEKLTRQFHCQIKQCKFKAIFLKSCSIIYTRNKHNHRMGNAGNRKKEEEKTNAPLISQSTLERDYVDQYGKLWNFHANIGKNISNDKFLTEFGFKDIHKGITTLNLYCTKRNPNGGKCPFAGIYLKSNGCLYTRGEHQHAKRGKKPQNIGDDYVDIFGKIWNFNKEIGKNVKREIFLNKFGFNNIRKTGLGLNLGCQKENGPNGKCKFAGIYLKSNGCLYTRGEHNHILREKNPSVGDDYVDHLGKVWPFHSKIGNQHNIPNEILRNKFGFTRIFNSQQTLNLYCKKEAINGERCPIKGIYLKSNGCLYIRGKHEHK